MTNQYTSMVPLTKAERLAEWFMFMATNTRARIVRASSYAERNSNWEQEELADRYEAAALYLLER